MCHSPAKTPGFIARQKFNRRTILQATAAFMAAATVGPTARSARRASAQAVPTQAQVWIQPDNVGGESGNLGFESEFPFYAIAPHWPGETDFDATVEVQTSRDGIVWSDPTVIGPAHTDAGPADKDNRIYGQLAFTDQSNYVRYRSLDANGTDRGLPGLQFTYIDATGGPGLDDISSDSPVPSLQRPPIISREEWGANLTYGGAERGASEWIPEYQTVEHVIIHHAETTNFRDPLSEIRSIHYYHAITRGWGDIGYNYLVDFMGNVYEGRVGGDNVVGGHAYQYAYGSAGICAMGSFKVSEATPEMLAGLTWITAWAARYLDPLGKADFHEQPNLPTICGHRDVNDSTCPGDGLYADLDYVREAVSEVLAGVRDVVPNPAFSPGQVIAVSADSANVRALPGTSEDIVTTVPFGAVFQVIEGPTTVNGEHWYHVRGDSGSGWLAASTFGASDAAPPAGEYAIGNELFVREDLVNLRDQPTLKGTIVATLAYMSPAKVVDGPMPANGYTWYKIETPDATGWITERYIAWEKDIAQPARFGVGDAVIVSDPAGIRLRSNPSTDGAEIKGLSPGVTGTIIDGPVNARGYAWVKLQTKDGTGWVAEQYLDVAPDSLIPEGTFGVGDEVVVDTDSLNLRSEAGATGPIIRTLGNGVTAVVIDGPTAANNLSWVKIHTDKDEGWAVESFLAKAADAAPSFAVGSDVHVNTDALNLRTSASLQADVVETLLQNTNARVAEGPSPADGHVWYRLEAGSSTGWASAQFLGKGRADAAVGTQLAIGDRVTSSDRDNVNVRAKASTTGDIVATIAPGATADVIAGPQDAEGYTWFQVRIAGKEGWSVGRWLARSESSPLAIGATAKVIDGELNLRDAASLGAEINAILPDATNVEVLEGPVEADGERWYRVSTSRYGTGWSSGTWLRPV